MNNTNYEIINTADGSKTIRATYGEESFHSQHGAVAESLHVFIKAGLAYAAAGAGKTVSVLEVGFGTGLNYLLSCQYSSNNNIQLQYTGVEPNIVPMHVIQALDYYKYVDEHVYQYFINSIHKVVTQNTLEKAVLPGVYDVVFFDAFSNRTQPDMWNAETIAKCVNHMAKGGCFVTYAITGNLKRILKSLGCTIEKLPGAPGKREMLRAIKL